MVNNYFPTALYYTIYKYTTCIDLTMSNLHEEKVKIVSLKKAGMAGIGRNQRGSYLQRFCKFLYFASLYIQVAREELENERQSHEEMMVKVEQMRRERKAKERMLKKKLEEEKIIQKRKQDEDNEKKKRIPKENKPSNSGTSTGGRSYTTGLNVEPNSGRSTKLRRSHSAYNLSKLEDDSSMGGSDFSGGSTSGFSGDISNSSSGSSCVPMPIFDRTLKPLPLNLHR